MYRRKKRFDSKEERRKWNKRYYRKSKHSILRQQKQYRDKNKEAISARRKQAYRYKIDHKDEIIAKQERAKAREDEFGSSIRNTLDEIFS